MQSIPPRVLFSGGGRGVGSPEISMERKGKSGGDRERGKRKGMGCSAPGGGTPSVPASPPGASADSPSPIVLTSSPFSMEESPSFPAAVRCARALLVLASLRSSSPTPVKQEWRKRDLGRAFTAVEANLKAAEAELAGVNRRTEKLWHVLRIAVALQVFLAFVLCALLFRLSDIDCPSSSYYHGYD